MQNSLSQITRARLYWLDAASGPMAEIQLCSGCRLYLVNFTFLFFWVEESRTYFSVCEWPTLGVVTGASQSWVKANLKRFFALVFGPLFVLSFTLPHLLNPVSFAPCPVGQAYSKSSTLNASFFFLSSLFTTSQPASIFYPPSLSAFIVSCFTLRPASHCIPSGIARPVDSVESVHQAGVLNSYTRKKSKKERCFFYIYYCFAGNLIFWNHHNTANIFNPGSLGYDIHWGE